jgi:transposase-like protein
MLQVWLEEGAPVDGLARRFGVSERTVFRILAAVRQKVDGGQARPVGSSVPSG